MSAVSNLLKAIGQKFERNLFGPIGSFFGNVQDIADIATGRGTGNSTVDSWIHTMAGDSPNGLQQWQANREDTAYQRSVADMKAAGLNPALMYGGSSGGPSASSAGSQSPSGISDFLQLAMLPLQVQAVKANIAKIQADTENTEANTENLTKRTSWIDALNSAEVESKKASTELDRQKAKEIDSRIDLAIAETQKSIEEAKTEESKRELMLSQIVLNNANAWRINELVPYEKLQLEASTEAEKAEAAYKFASAAYQNKLINSNYIDSVIKMTGANATVAEVEAWLSSDQYNRDNETWFQRFGHSLISGLNLAIRAVSPIKHYSVSNSSNTVNVNK